MFPVAVAFLAVHAILPSPLRMALPDRSLRPILVGRVLERVFPHGLNKDDTPEGKELLRSLRLAFDECEDDQEGERPNPAIHKAWIDYVIKQDLGLPDEELAERQDVPDTEDNDCGTRRDPPT
jgi:hypothetical protein